MQSLNLSGEAKKSDGPIKSLMWPTVENAWDVDYLGQQGFWICTIIAIASLGLTLLAAWEAPAYAIWSLTSTFSVIECLIYFVGGLGVRQASPIAAVTVFALYALDQLASGHSPSVLSLIIAAVLLSNVRATILASRWTPANEGEDRPSRFNETFRDKLVDQLPPRVWPVLRYPFYVVATIMLSLIVLGLTMRLVKGPQPTVNENDVPSAVVTP
jgi:hypothetical protein